MAPAESQGSRLLPWEDVDGHLCPRTPWVLTHWRSRRAACPPLGQQHTPRTHRPGTLTASVALTLKVCSDPGDRGLNPAQPQRPAPGLAAGHPDPSPNRNHTTFSHRPVFRQSPEWAQWLIRQARRLFDQQTQSKPQAPGLREERRRRAGRPSLRGPTGQGLGLPRGRSYTQLGEEGAPSAPGPRKMGGSPVPTTSASSSKKELRVSLASFSVAHAGPCGTTTHKTQTKGCWPFLSALPAQHARYQTHIVLRSDP